MSKSSLRLMAVILAVAIIGVLFAGLDDLPRDVRGQIATERSAYGAAQSTVKAAREELANDLAKEAALFGALPSAKEYGARLEHADSSLGSAGRDLEELAKLEKANRRADRDRAVTLLAHVKPLRTGAVADAEGVRKDATHWIELKQHLPQEVQEMERDYRAIQAVDLAGASAAVQKAGQDWPEKKADLDSRLSGAKEMAAQSDELWRTSADARRAAAANDVAKVDFAGLFAAADALKTTATELPKQNEQLKTLSAQLYQSWDKILADMEVRGVGNAKEYDQKIRTIRTTVADATGTPGASASDEKWVDVTRAQYEAGEKNLGMAVEHKAAGKYDTESERVVQPAGFAYMAPPGQSNQYGHWDHHDGRDFWVFYGQYALMRDLLFNHQAYRPFERYEYYDYRTYQQRNQTYYGRDATTSAPKYGTSGTTTQEHYSGSTFAKGGGFKDSKYASKAGGYRDSQYSTPMMRDPNADHSARKFGTGGSSSRQAEPSAPRSYRQSPTPYRPSAPRSPGRSFGSPRRR